jgi:glucosylglycerate synthase
LAEETFLEDDFLRQLMSVGEVDLLVGIPSYNNAATMGQTVETIEESFQQNFVRDRVVILNVDGGSSDDTRNVLLQRNERRNGGHRGLTSLRTVHRVSWTYGSAPSSGLAVRTILAAADLLRAKSCAIISPTAGNLTPSWVANLLRPIYRERFDYLAPLYARNKFQGLLARNLLYPMSRAVFGYRIRELYSDEWGFSGRLASQCLDQDVWHEEAVQTRPEAWMGVTAISAELNCCQYFLGQKAAPASGAGTDIVEAIRQAVGSLFWCLEKYESQWLNRAGSQTVPTFGPDHELCEETPPTNPEKFFAMFRSGVNELEPLLASILTRDTHAQVKAIALLDADKFRFANELWVRTLYEFAGSYHHEVLNRDHLVQSVVPLYRGLLYSFLMQHANSSADEMEADAEQLGLEFERQKPYLVERWKGEKLR